MKPNVFRFPHRREKILGSTFDDDDVLWHYENFIGLCFKLKLFMRVNHAYSIVWHRHMR